MRCVENRTNSDYEDLPGRRSLLSKFTPENIGEKLRRAMLSARPARQVVAEPRRRGLLILALVLMAVAIANGDDAKLSQAQRMAIIRSLLAERPFVHRAFPMGKSGIRIEGDKITPSEAEMNQTIGHYGAAAKPGERVRITAVRFEHHGISLDINGGPTRRKSWKDRINVGVSGGDPGDASSGYGSDEVYDYSEGSTVFLAIKDDVASLTAEQVKEMLAPVLDFKAMTVAEAYEKSLSPLLAKAVKEHHALVGMDRDMVIYALGRPVRRLRESQDGKEYEEWIYGNPPQDVEFIRFLADKVVRIEEMKVSGEKVVRSEDEIGGIVDASAKNPAMNQTQPGAMAAGSASTEPRREPPSLLRPGEKPIGVDGSDSKRDPNPRLPQDLPPGPN